MYKFYKVFILSFVPENVVRTYTLHYTIVICFVNVKDRYARFHLVSFGIFAVADPGLPVRGGIDLVRRHRLPRRLHFENVVC